jgi:hypothetical protein
MNRQRQIDVIGVYEYGQGLRDLAEGRTFTLNDIIPAEMKTPGERLAIELTVTVRKADKNDPADGMYLISDNPA